MVTMFESIQWSWPTLRGLTWALVGLVAASISLVWLFAKPKSKKLKLPPGPKPWPIIGNLPVLLDFSKPPHQIIENLTKTYGPIIILKLGLQYMVFVSDPKLTMESLKENDHLFANRPANLLAGEYLLYGDRHITIGNQGDYHTFARKLVVTELLTPKKLASFQATRKEQQDALISKAFKAYLNNEPLNLHQGLSAMTLNIISQLAFSRKFHGSDSKAQREWTQIIPEMTENFGLLLAESFHPSLRWVDSLTGHRSRMQRCFKRMDVLLDDILLEHTQNLNVLTPQQLKEYEPKDFMDIALLQRHGDHPEYFTDNAVKAVSLDLIVAGSESMTTVTEWAMSELLLNPHVMKKAQEEVDRVVGTDRFATEEDSNNLPYIAAIVKEAFRMHEPLPWLLPHSNRAECKIGDYDIPANSFVNFNVYGMSRNAALWKDPSVYNPDRFLSGNTMMVDVKGTYPQLMPFGGGRRICPGIGFAHNQMHTIIARLVHSFDWSIPDGQKVDMSERAGAVASRVKQLCANPKPRLAAHLYEPLK